MKSVRVLLNHVSVETECPSLSSITNYYGYLPIGATQYFPLLK